ncbi:MAG: hypothetical protein PHI58_06585 [Candidatus Omnitrophica bacterium]|nr:hypothetical protein [Candidatus Omnitrophota bacterium]
MTIALYQAVAVVGSLLLLTSGFLRFTQSGSPKELFIGALYFLANLIIFCM